MAAAPKAWSTSPMKKTRLFWGPPPNWTSPARSPARPVPAARTANTCCTWPVPCANWARLTRMCLPSNGTWRNYPILAQRAERQHYACSGWRQRAHYHAIASRILGAIQRGVGQAQQGISAGSAGGARRWLDCNADADGDLARRRAGMHDAQLLDCAAQRRADLQGLPRIGVGQHD